MKRKRHLNDGRIVHLLAHSVNSGPECSLFYRPQDQNLIIAVETPTGLKAIDDNVDAIQWEFV